MTDPLGFLYSGDRYRMNIPNYHPPAMFAHGERTLVAECPKDPADGDGQAVRLYETRWPATVYCIEALPGANSMGEPKAGFTITLGSSERILAENLVRAITTGMLDVETGPAA